MKKAEEHPSKSKKSKTRQKPGAAPELKAPRSGAPASPISNLTDGSRIKAVPPSKDAIQRLLAIPLLHADPAPSSGFVAGRLANDSWQHGPAIALRDVADGQIRRLRFEAGPYILELLALRTGLKWEFSARLRRGERVIHRSVLAVGKRKLLAQRGGYFLWSSPSVPRSLAVLLSGQQLVFKGIPWR